MNKLVWLMVAMTSGVAVAAETESWPQQDGDVTVVWQEPENYRDVDATSGVQSRYQNHVFAKLGKHMQEQITPKLQTGEKITVTVTDLDLAGDVRPTFGATTNDIRVVKSVYPPMIHFTYQLNNGDGEVLQQQKVELRDMSFDSGGLQRNRHESLHYEMNMLDDWVKKILEPQLANR
ncbi:DUF3016 domain-containing protein [Ferrimonas lipolytica]|uniref:DUF3016 domain-containing protein n=1 Tax=Ferrimonas lipolytica TaxID=2724191 RepID=A0A6H1UJ24_9GAMM|nr:DUF3016 domain-containing protein [Ferrimonas lipolytica]QIZ78629.1 DUF3016 domain-containing protein [Ferrimonas lipolytica]